MFDTCVLSSFETSWSVGLSVMCQNHQHSLPDCFPLCVYSVSATVSNPLHLILIQSLCTYTPYVLSVPSTLLCWCLPVKCPFLAVLPPSHLCPGFIILIISKHHCSLTYGLRLVPYCTPHPDSCKALEILGTVFISFETKTQTTKYKKLRRIYWHKKGMC